MAIMFGPQKTSVFGSFGEFTIGDGTNVIRAKYILTKIKPGDDGLPECELASQMRPWREVFDLKELSFEELLQRDLDDSRVAHDLIPYLLGKSGSQAKFFPPILAVIVPRKQGESGIEGFYPIPNTQDGLIENYGDLFDFKQLVWDSKPTPFASLSYNRQRSAFIIVDGQHRAMAVLALHRQLCENWGDNAYASYYDHISVTAGQVESIELPACIIYFPDLHEGNSELKRQGINLSSVCREIFLVVNRTAKRVSESRELLLDDRDLAAHLTRRTLSRLKNRDEIHAGLARIYAISYGDSDSELRQNEVVSGQCQYSSAIALHKIHRALSFGLEGAFRFDDYVDISYRRNTRNKNRAPEILLGTSTEKHSILPRHSGKSLPPNEVDEVVERLGDLADTVLLGLLDRFRPFTVHNSELQDLRIRLSDVHVRTEPEQKKAYNLIFEGSGVRDVFESHFARLKETQDELNENDQTVPGHLKSQIKNCESAMKTLGVREREFQRLRACRFYSVNPEIFDKTDNEEDRTELSEKARKVFQTIATQAFQLGYAMAIFTVVEELKRQNSNTSPFQYQQRLELVQFVTDIFLSSLNRYFSPNNKTIHRKLRGYISEPRASVFDANSSGLRGLLAMSVNELNERQWRFFRYAVLEIVHSPICWDTAQETMKQTDNGWTLNWYKAAIPDLVGGIFKERNKYIEDAVEASVKGREFEMMKTREHFEAKGAGKSEEQIQQLLRNLENSRRTNAMESACNHLKASLRTIETNEEMVKRLEAGL